MFLVYGLVIFRSVIGQFVFPGPKPIAFRFVMFLFNSVATSSISIEKQSKQISVVELCLPLRPLQSFAAYSSFHRGEKPHNKQLVSVFICQFLLELTYKIYNHEKIKKISIMNYACHTHIYMQNKS